MPFDAGEPAPNLRPPPGPSSVAQDPDGVWRLRGHRETIYAVAISSEGAWAATGSGDRTVRLWDLKRHLAGAVVVPADEAVTALAFSPKGDWLAAGDRAFQVRLIRVADGAVVRTQAHPDAVSALDFSPDGRWLAVAGFGGNAAVYPVEAAGAAKCDLRGRSALFTDAGKRLVLASQSAGLSLFDFPACKPGRQTPTAPHQPFAAVSGKSTLVATRNGRESTVLLWDAAAGKPSGKLEGHTAGVTTVQLSSDGARALTASEDGTVRLWDLEKRTELMRVSQPGVPFAALGPGAAFAVIAAGVDARVVPMTR